MIMFKIDSRTDSFPFIEQMHPIVHEISTVIMKSPLQVAKITNAKPVVRVLGYVLKPRTFGTGKWLPGLLVSDLLGDNVSDNTYKDCHNNPDKVINQVPHICSFHNYLSW
jgi:hypothetical protein